MRTRTPEKRGYRLTAGRKALLAQGFSIEDILNNKTTMHINNTSPSASSAITLTEPMQQFDINQRFEFLEKIVTMVADGIQHSAVISGGAGLGKSTLVNKTLQKNGYTDVSHLDAVDCEGIDKKYRVIKGVSSSKGLYNTLYENRDSIIIFDDCSGPLTDPKSIDVIKSATESSDQRIVSWNIQSRDDSIPTMFRFNGSIIFITNMRPESIDSAIKSRAMNVDVHMTKNETVERMSHIVCQGSFLPEYSDTIKMDALEFISTNRDKVKNLSLRSLITVAKIRAANDDWYSMAQYMTC